MLTHTEMYSKHMVPLTYSSGNPDFSVKTEKSMSVSTLLCITLKYWLTNICTRIHIQAKRIFRSLVLYLKTVMPPGHKTDYCSFETWSTTRPLNPGIFTYIHLILRVIKHCVCIFSFYPPWVMWNTGIIYSRETIFLSKETKGQVRKIRPQTCSLSPSHITLILRLN